MSTISERQRQVKQQAAQEAIYEAALEVISRPDFNGLKMQDIAASAGIVTGTLYLYFKNKEDLLYYVDRRLHEAILGQMKEISTRPDPAPQRLSDVIEEVFEFAGKYHVVFDLAERSGVPDRMPSEDKRDLVGRAVGCFEQILADGIESRLFRPVETRRTATVLFNAIIGVLEMHKFFGDYDYEKSKRDLQDTFFDYLRPE
ncbi:MAG: TetR/AcrR family transcriptional regulator [Phycisphaerae bacterium]|nr:TetR/AcrR family transcriptional regulator [Phycisphaerae bacterium]NIW95345.1 TetR family transcriptional regulator [Phycisphaerae bacterium]